MLSRDALEGLFIRAGGGGRSSRVGQLHAHGFDRSEAIPFRRQWHVGCSQCQALVINGHPSHEPGCPHAVFECRGCDALVHRRGAYCADCA